MRTPKAPAAALPQLGIGRGRRISNGLFWTLCAASLVLVVAPTAWMVGGVIARAVPHWRWSVLTQPSAGQSGGLLNAIVGTVLLIVGVLAVSGTVARGNRCPRVASGSCIRQRALLPQRS